MTCPRCQAASPDGARFCEDCGARLDITCSVCGQPVGADKKFCRSCGARLSIQPDSLHLTRVLHAEISRRANPHLQERAGGERKRVTVLFADLKGSMELLADRDLEEARKILDPVLERMMEAVRRYEGTVNQVMGDGIAGAGALLLDGRAENARRAADRALELAMAFGERANEAWALQVLYEIAVSRAARS
jgi:class 3 adenylate cyclase